MNDNIDENLSPTNLQPYTPDLIQCLPPWYRNTKLVKGIQNSAAIEIGKAKYFIDDLKNQFYVDTATWGLGPIWEKPLGITTDLSKSYEYRRSAVKAKLVGFGPVNKAMIKSIAEAFGASEVDVINNSSDNSFLIQFSGANGILKNTQGLMDVIEDIKPCHLDYKFIIDYLAVLIMQINFSRYDSVELTKCGTIDDSGNSIIVTEGRTYNDKVIDRINKYFSIELLAASQKLYPNGSLGKSFIENIKDIKKAYFSNTLQQASNNTVTYFTDGVRKTESLADKKSYYRSIPFRIASDSSFICMIDGLSKNEKVMDKYSEYFSQPFQVAMGSDGLRKTEYIRDKLLSYNSEAFKEASDNSLTYMSDGIRESEKITDRCSMFLSVDILQCSTSVYCGGGVYA